LLHDLHKEVLKVLSADYEIDIPSLIAGYSKP